MKRFFDEKTGKAIDGRAAKNNPSAVTVGNKVQNGCDYFIFFDNRFHVYRDSRDKMSDSQFAQVDNFKLFPRYWIKKQAYIIPPCRWTLGAR